MKSFNFDELLALTNEEFANHIRSNIEDQQRLREVMHYNVQVDRHGFEEAEPLQFPEDDSPTVVVDFLVGFEGKALSLWTFWFDTYTKKFDYGVVNHEQVNRFVSMQQGASNLPELGIYVYSN